jgi:hypothetical protein
MHYSKPLTNIRSLRYLFLLLTLGVVAVALAVADSSVPTQTALQPPTPHRRQLNETPPPRHVILLTKIVIRSMHET